MIDFGIAGLRIFCEEGSRMPSSSSGSMVTIGFAAGSPVCVLKGLGFLVLEKKRILFFYLVKRHF